jgi:hypothetical protein
LFSNGSLNHHAAAQRCVGPAAALLREFFSERRAQLRAERDAGAAGDAAAPIPTGEEIESLPPDEQAPR